MGQFINLSLFTLFCSIYKPYEVFRMLHLKIGVVYTCVTRLLAENTQINKRMNDDKLELHS